MSTRIGYDSSGKPLGRLLNSIVVGVLDNRYHLAKLKSAMDSMASGSTFEVIESELGVDTGQGETVYNIVAGMLAQLNGATFDDLPRLYKG
jgi:hypothetical protein